MFAIGSKNWPGISKLTEEFGEVLQIVGKLIATGGELAHYSGLNLKAALEDELGDALAAISFVIHYCGLDDAKIQRRAYQKRALFEKWHEEQRALFDKDGAA
jgi:NTP pyrophosphatase (non-canonical NTP hydrolase)